MACRARLAAATLPTWLCATAPRPAASRLVASTQSPFTAGCSTTKTRTWHAAMTGSPHAACRRRRRQHHRPAPALPHLRLRLPRPGAQLGMEWEGACCAWLHELCAAESLVPAGNACWQWPRGHESGLCLAHTPGLTTPWLQPQPSTAVALAATSQVKRQACYASKYGWCMHPIVQTQSEAEFGILTAANLPTPCVAAPARHLHRPRRRRPGAVRHALCGCCNAACNAS